MLQPYVSSLDVIGVCPNGLEQMDPNYEGVLHTGWNVGFIDGFHDAWAVTDDVGFIEKAKNFALARYAIAGNVVCHRLLDGCRHDLSIDVRG